MVVWQAGFEESLAPHEEDSSTRSLTRSRKNHSPTKAHSIALTMKTRALTKSRALTKKTRALAHALTEDSLAHEESRAQGDDSIITHEDHSLTR